ncbi:MAG: D-alanyl-D-alanine carboxypeptidase/D-alanyl-D-alanine-endopeptidase [Planctomycetes bacterium]|nr:D-alanyl-D-alanine carboxypeptidase/D-alanyl-D-alanine-endopeptidase [Planctomycetota bacterium]
MKRPVRFILVALLVLTTVTCASSASLTSRINSIVSRKSQKKVNFGIKIIDARTGKSVYSHNADKPLIPASNMKLVVSAAALKELGADYQFTTQIGLLGETLVIIGHGDPLLGDIQTLTKNNLSKDHVIKEIIQALKQKGVTRIKDIIVDSGFFEDNRIHPSWPRDQLNKEHACEVSGLNYNGNCIRITTTRRGGSVAVTTDPKTKYLNITNKVKIINKGSSAVGSYRDLKTPNKITVHGRCRKSAGFRLAIERPAAMFGFLLAEHLADAGIDVRGELLEKHVKTDKRIKIIKTFKTPMHEVLHRCNKDSMALAAESLLKTISAQNSKDNINGNWPHGLSIVAKYLNSLGVNSLDFTLDDARGLSRKNKLTAGAITKVLLDRYNSKDSDIFFDSLAIGGVDGTLRKHFGEKKYKGKVIGKTGFINGVKSLSGQAKTTNGVYLFSILTEHANASTTAAKNDIAKAIIDNK